ncbi:hypothetical protein K151_2499 [Proteus hauseri ZMd44]|nr:hypothetical protein K151_2499 [Proteus hauseri ZMd44]
MGNLQKRRNKEMEMEMEMDSINKMINLENKLILLCYKLK